VLGEGSGVGVSRPGVSGDLIPWKDDGPEQLGIGTPETLRKWVRQAQVDAGQRAGTTTDESVELKRLRRENAELRRANEILKAASAFFAAELDRPFSR
jgi:transposase